jgi:hypothetical protein
LHLEAKLKRAASDAALALAKQPRQMQARPEEANLKVQGDPASAAATPQVKDPATNHALA